MKVLICNKYYFAFGGTDVYLLQLQDMLSERGHEVAFFSMDHPKNRWSPYRRYFLPYADFKDPSLGVFAKVGLAKRVVYYSRARRLIGELISDFKPDIAHVRNIYHHMSPSVLWELRARRIPVVYHINDFKCICPAYNLVSHGRVCEKCTGGKLWNVVTERCHSSSLGANLTLCAEAYLHKWLRTYDKCVDRFIAPSEFCRDKLVENGFDKDKIDVLAHFQAVLPDRHGEESGEYILYFGRLSREKGVRDLVSAMIALPHINLVIAGDGPERHDLESFSIREGLKNVSFTGRLDGAELEAVIGGARFTVMPSLVFETMGKVILESYGSGRPVVASNLGTRPEFVKHGHTGLLFEPYNVGDLTEKIAYLYERPELCREMGRNGRKVIAEQHSPQTYYARLMESYERTMQTLR